MVFGRKKKEEKKREEKPKISVSQISMPHRAESDTKIAEDIRLIIKEWLDPKHINRKTRLNKRQVRAITILQGLADKFDIKTLKDFLTEFRTNKLSEDGQSSKELENILKSRMPELQNEGSLEKISKYLE